LKFPKTVDNFVASLTKSSVVVAARSELRCSGLPYCPIMDLADYGEDFEETYDMFFYTSIGTAYHENAQKFLVAGKFGHCIWGDWCWPGEEDKPELWKRDCFRPKPRIVKGRKVYPIYKEVGLSYKHLLGGHCDMVWKDKHGWHLLDFKTTSQAVMDPKCAGYYPDSHHTVQVRAYVIILKKTKGIDIVDAHLMYVSRNKVKEWKKTSKKDPYVYSYKLVNVELDLAGIEEHIENSLKARKAVLLYLKGKSSLNKIFKYKPCQDPNDYYKLMECRWFGKERCPYHSNGMCYNVKKMKKEIESWDRPSEYKKLNRRNKNEE
jgi:hypothetical protein